MMTALVALVAILETALFFWGDMTPGYRTMSSYAAIGCWCYVIGWASRKT